MGENICLFQYRASLRSALIRGVLASFVRGAIRSENPRENACEVLSEDAGAVTGLKKRENSLLSARHKQKRTPSDRKSAGALFL